MWKKPAIVCLKYYPSIFLGAGADEVTKNLSQNEILMLSLPNSEQNWKPFRE
jgi:hypothetical protein